MVKKKFFPLQSNIVLIIYLIIIFSIPLGLIFGVLQYRNIQIAKSSEEFKECIEDVALKFCTSIGQDYRRVIYHGMVGDIPVQIVCSVVPRSVEVKRYKFLEEEIQNCRK